MTNEHFAVFKVPLVSADELRIAKERGEDMSYGEEDRVHINIMAISISQGFEISGRENEEMPKIKEGGEMTRRKLKDRRCGPDRRGYEYSKHIPERRSGNDQRIYWGNRRSGMTDRRINSFYPHTPERRGIPEGFPSWDVMRPSY